MSTTIKFICLSQRKIDVNNSLLIQIVIVITGKRYEESRKVEIERIILFTTYITNSIATAPSTLYAPTILIFITRVFILEQPAHISRHIHPNTTITFDNTTHSKSNKYNKKFFEALTSTVNTKNITVPFFLRNFQENDDTPCTFQLAGRFKKKEKKS